MIAATVGFTALAERLWPRLGALYGDEAGVALDAILAICRSHEGQAQPSPRRWDETDVVLIAYADHVRQHGETPLAALGAFLDETRLGEMFSLVHLLPFFPSSSDDGFSVIDYRGVDPEFGTWADVDRLADRCELVVDLVLNHVSRSSTWFRGYQAGRSPFDRFFVEADPDDDLTAVVRPRTSPLLTELTTSRGRRHVWTTFSDDQIDLNYAEPLVLAEIVDILLSYVRHGARIIRLDAVGFLWKEPGTACIHHPNTHLVVKVLRDVVDAVAPGTWLLTEANVPHHENASYWGSGDEAHLIYNFALAPLLLDALLSGDGSFLSRWLGAIPDPPAGTSILNFTASHDGVGIRPLEALVPRGRIEQLLAEVERRGGLVSFRSAPSGNPEPYELNITYFDALSDPDYPDSDRSGRRFLLSQAIALALRGIPAVYLPSVLAVRNDIAGVRATGRPRSINRHKFDRPELDAVMAKNSTSSRTLDDYRRLLAVRRGHPAFHPDGGQEVLDLGSPALVGFLRTSVGGDQAVLVAANVSEGRHVVDLSRYGLRAGRDLASGRLMVDGRQHLVLEPYEFVWLPVWPASDSLPTLSEVHR